ncbi:MULTISPECIES: hypothetical protein [Caproicibacterium]|uniref:Collagen-like protein n=1 Tax=Caproicibacterium argilliputei TaxID=3030016 RepID=A0AA97DBP3_9FIRM|nr:hypothetical protein [Caproicibacterium argilliputei]WOC32819.1 hypothetical protein PXC00_02790 [Caproicibacterium argilliputei]
MAYTPTDWKNGDIITADRLNKLEQGVSNEQIGPQGPKGDTGEAGKDGVTPQLQSNGTEIQVSTDNGGTFKTLVRIPKRF